MKSIVSSIPLLSTSMKQTTSVKVLGITQFEEEALSILGASSPLKLVTSIKDTLDLMYLSMVMVSKDKDFIDHSKKTMNVIEHNKYTFILHGGVCDWQNLFTSCTLEDQRVLDLIFDLLVKGNNIFKLEKVGDAWKLK